MWDAGRERDPGGGLCEVRAANDIREELAKAYATENDLQVNPADVMDALELFEQGLKGADALKSQLSDAGVTRPEVEAFAARLLLVNAVQQAVVKERLDEAALRDAYQANLAQFTTLEVGHILVADEADAERSRPTSRRRRLRRRRSASPSTSSPRRRAGAWACPPWRSSRRSSIRLRRGHPGTEAGRDLRTDPDAVRLARDPPRATRRGAVRGRP